MIALNKLPEEYKKLVFSFFIICLLFRIIFFNEGIINILKIVGGFYWLFIIPGFNIMFSWMNNYDFKIRLLIGTALGISLYGVLSFYIGLFGLNIKYHIFLIPSVINLFCAYFIAKLIKNNNANAAIVEIVKE